MSDERRTSMSGEEAAFSPVDNELPMRWYRRLYLAPADGLGTGRRALFFAAVTWIPIIVWAAWPGQDVMADTGESLLRHYGVHVRCLLAIPLFVLAEGALHGTVRNMVSMFLASGAIQPTQRAAFDKTLDDVRAMRDSSLPWVFVIGLTLAWFAIDHPSVKDDAFAWAASRDGGMGFGGWWYAYVARPIFAALALGWLWRMVLMTVWLWRVSRLELSMVPTHPDRTGGIGFVEKLPGAYMLVSLAVTAVVGSKWAHEIAQHGATLDDFKLPAALLLVIWTLLALLPLLALVPMLIKTRKRAIADYAALVGEQGRLVQRRWILREKVEDAPILGAPEIGPVADAASMYNAVKAMRSIPIGKVAFIKILAPVVLPMVVVAAMQVPLKDMLLKLAKALI